MKHKSGSLVWILAKGQALRNQDGIPYRMAGSHSDITERISFQEALITNEDRYNRALSGTGAGLWDWDMINNTVFFSKQWKNMLGYQENEISNDFSEWKKLWHPEEEKIIEKKINDYLEGRTEKYEVEHRLRSKDNTWRWILTRGDIEKDASGNPVRWTGTNIDITKAKEAQEIITQNNNRLKLAQEVGNVGSWEHDFSTNKVTWSEQAFAIYEEDPSTFEVNFENVIAHFHPDDRDTVIQSLRNSVDEKKDLRVQHRIITRKGNVRQVLEAGRIILDEMGTPVRIVGSVADITEQKKSEEALKISEQTLKTYIDASPLGIFVTDFNGNYLDVNKTGEELTGYTRKELLTLKIADIIEPEHLDDGLAIARQTVEKGKGEGICLARRKDGSTYWLWIVATNVNNEYLLAFCQDVSKRIKAEQELVLAKKQAETASTAKSEFLANMSHEIRTPLNGVIGFTELLKETPLSPIQELYVNNANISGHTLLGIINDILDFSKIEAGMLQLESLRTDIYDLLETSIDLIRYPAGQKDIELLLNIDPQLPRYTLTDPVRLKQILSNLLGNAVKFTEKGEIELSALYEPINETSGKITFSVRDTGIGISPDQQQKLFKAFSQADSSTTRKFGGTGLGLIISDLIAKKMNSKIYINSAQGMGTTFYFSIITPTEKDQDMHNQHISGIKRCLIIDDNLTACNNLKKILAGQNIECEICADGFTGLRSFESSDPYDLILCDYSIPRMNGIQTIECILAEGKQGKKIPPIVLLHNSFEDESIITKSEEIGIDCRLSKPVKKSELLSCIYRLQKQEFLIDKPDAPVFNSIQQQDFRKQSVTILIAEDVAINMLMIKSMLSKIIPNARLIEAANGSEAISRYLEENPDLLFMDIQMPEKDGVEATRKIRELEKENHQHVPIIALTAGAFTEEMEKCLAAGMDAFLTKPVEVERIKKVINQYLKSTNAEKHSD